MDKPDCCKIKKREQNSACHKVLVYPHTKQNQLTPNAKIILIIQCV